ncbi:MAG: hypothetical protein AB7G44_08020 [Bacteroidia bacterium]
MRIVFLILFVLISPAMQAQNYLAFDAKKAGEEKRAALAAAEKNKSMTVKYVKPYDIGIKSNTSAATAMINIELAETTDSLSLELYDSKGENVEYLFMGELPAGSHSFQFIPKKTITRPYIAVFKMADKIESMRVVKFNSF